MRKSCWFVMIASAVLLSVSGCVASSDTGREEAAELVESNVSKATVEVEASQGCLLWLCFASDRDGCQGSGEHFFQSLCQANAQRDCEETCGGSCRVDWMACIFD